MGPCGPTCAGAGKPQQMQAADRQPRGTPAGPAGSAAWPCTAPPAAACCQPHAAVAAAPTSIAKGALGAVKLRGAVGAGPVAGAVGLELPGNLQVIRLKVGQAGQVALGDAVREPHCRGDRARRRRERGVSAEPGRRPALGRTSLRRRARARTVKARQGKASHGTACRPTFVLAGIHGVDVRHGDLQQWATRGRERWAGGRQAGRHPARTPPPPRPQPRSHAPLPIRAPASHHQHLGVDCGVALLAVGGHAALDVCLDHQLHILRHARGAHQRAAPHLLRSVAGGGRGA